MEIGGTIRGDHDVHLGRPACHGLNGDPRDYMGLSPHFCNQQTELSSSVPINVRRTLIRCDREVDPCRRPENRRMVDRMWPPTMLEGSAEKPY